MIALTVYGTAAPKGSTKAFWRAGMKHAVVTHDSTRTRPWSEAVKQATLDELERSGHAHGCPIAEPIALFVRFLLPRPKSAPKRVLVPAKKPDLDKLVRALKDALKDAGLYRDDAQVIVTIARKEFAGGLDDPDGARGIPRALIQVGLASSFRYELSWTAAATGAAMPTPGELFAQRAVS